MRDLMALVAVRDILDIPLKQTFELNIDVIYKELKYQISP